MSARREYEMFFRLSGGMSGEFSSSFRNASSQMNALRTAMDRTNSVLRDISAYNRQRTAIERQNDTIASSQARLERLQERHRELQDEMANTANPSQRLRSQLERNEQQIQACADSIGNQNQRLQEMQAELERTRTDLQNAGVDTDNLTQSTEEYRRQLQRISDHRDFMQNISQELDTATGKFRETDKEFAGIAAGMAGAVTAVYAGVSKPAMDFESAFTGVRKTVDATEEQFAELREGILDMSQNDVTATATEIAAVAEAAGQLGIETDNILSFSKVMIDLGESTNLSSEQAASNLAKFANVTQMSQKDFGKLGSVIVDLGNNFATTESDIVTMATRLASTGELTGLSEAQIMASATALSSLGIEAEAGGTAMSKILKMFQLANARGDMSEFASVAGMSEEAFSKLYEGDSLKAISAFTKGLNDTERNGKSAVQILDDMEIREVRLSNAILALASSDDILTKAADLASNAWEDNTALSEEAEKRYATTESQVDMTKNAIENLRIEIGDMTLPIIQDAAGKLSEFVRGMQRWVSENKDMIADAASLAVEVGKYALVLKGSQMVYYGVKSGVLGVAKGIGKVKTAILAAQDAGKGKGLSTFLSTLTGLSGMGAVGAVVGGVTAAVAGLAAVIYLNVKAAQEYRKEIIDGQLFDNGGQSLKEYTEALKESTSESYKFAQEINDASEELDNIEYEMSKAKDSVDLYRQAIEDTGTITPEIAEEMYAPFNTLCEKLEQDFTYRYDLVFNAFNEAASGVASELGVSIAEISGTLANFKARFSESTTESQDRINQFLDKAKSDEGLTDEDYKQFEEDMGYITDMSDAVVNGNLANFNATAEELKGWDFGKDQEGGIENLNDLYSYGKAYVDELDEAQKNLNNEYDTLRQQAKIMLDRGKIDKKEYDDTMKALDSAQEITYTSYREKRDDFTESFKGLYDSFIAQIDNAVAEGASQGSNWGESLWNHLQGTFWGYSMNWLSATSGNGFLYSYGDIINGKVPDAYAEKIKHDNTKEQYSGVYDAVDQFGGDAPLGEGVKMPGFASGTDNTPAAFIAGERGPELIVGAPGRTVFTNGQTEAMFGVLPRAVAALESGNAQPAVNITINSSPVFGGNEDYSGYNDDLAEKVRTVIIDLFENERRNAYA